MKLYYFTFVRKNDSKRPAIISSQLQLMYVKSLFNGRNSSIANGTVNMQLGLLVGGFHKLIFSNLNENKQ